MTTISSSSSTCRFSSTNIFLATIVIFLAISSVVNILHSQYASEEFMSASQRLVHQFVRRRKSTSSSSFSSFPTELQPPNQASMLQQQQHRLAGLTCSNTTKEDNDIFEREMVYWSDIPSDYKYQSPFQQEQEKFLTFEPDHGGWNNIRMAMETVLVMAHAMGRTLVLPPEQHMYLLRNEDKKHSFTFKDFFHLDTLHDEHDGIKIITMEEFLTKHAAQLRDPVNSQAVTLPNGRTNWDGESNLTPLWNYLRSVGHTNTNWTPDRCVAVFPSKPSDPTSVDRLQHLLDDILKENNGKVPDPHSFTGRPVPVNGTTMDRLREHLGGDNRDKLCIYDIEMERQPLLHFSVDHKDNTRLLTHFYAFLFFEDWRHDLFYKRLVRDKIRYLDNLMCAAAKIIQAIRNRARERNVTNVHGDYDAIHIRRGDFQYRVTRLDPKEIYINSKDELTEGATLFVATDETKGKRELFQPLADHYDLVYLDDFQEYYKDLGTNYYGMLDQLVCYKSRVFIGTWFSTFSGYINRLRGYYSVKEKMDGYEQGIIKSWYFAPLEKKYEMQEYRAVRKPIYMREFPTAWRNIDQGIEELVALPK